MLGAKALENFLKRLRSLGVDDAESFLEETRLVLSKEMQEVTQSPAELLGCGVEHTPPEPMRWLLWRGDVG